MTQMIIQVLSAFIGSIGFAIFFKMKGRQIVMAGIGGAATWALYLVLQSVINGYFIPNMLASVFVGIYAEIMARVNKAPSTIFLTAAAVPLIPGGALYYAMAGLVNEDRTAFAANGEKALTIALAIALGFVIVAIGSKYYNMINARKLR